MVKFSKNSHCPASQELLRFQTGGFQPRDHAVGRHVADCDFCAAEVEFYAHYPQAEDKIESAEIPRPLYELAEALLSDKHKDFSLLNKLLGESEIVKI